MKQYDIIITLVKEADDRYEAEEKVRWLINLLEEKGEDYCFSAKCTGW